MFLSLPFMVLYYEAEIKLEEPTNGKCLEFFSLVKWQ